MGRPPSVEPEEVCRAIALHPEPVVTASDIYKEIGLTKRGTQQRLNALTEEGYLDKKYAGSSATVFWLTDKGRNTLSQD